jgi:hypothetical protein
MYFTAVCPRITCNAVVISRSKSFLRYWECTRCKHTGLTHHTTPDLETLIAEIAAGMISRDSHHAESRVNEAHARLIAHELREKTLRELSDKREALTAIGKRPPKPETKQKNAPPKRFKSRAEKRNERWHENNVQLIRNGKPPIPHPHARHLDALPKPAPQTPAWITGPVRRRAKVEG